MKQASYAVAIDIGGTNTVVGLVDKSGNVLKQASFKTAEYSHFDSYIEKVASVVLPLIQVAGGLDKIVGIGVGAPNGNYYTSTIVDAPNLPWSGALPLGERLAELTNMHVTVTNDANAAAIGEMTYGCAKQLRDFIMITLGTGVGSGIVIDGKLVYGHDGFAGELGHTTIVRGAEGRICGCGRTGCLETYASATGVVRTARLMLDEDPSQPSLMRQIPASDLTACNVYEAAMENDVIACRVFEYTGQLLGEAICDFVAFSAPEAIILFGGLTGAGELLLAPIRKSMDEHILNLWRGKVDLRISTIAQGDAAVLGAAALAWQ